MSLNKLIDWLSEEDDPQGAWECGYETARHTARRLLKEAKEAEFLHQLLPPGWRFNSADFSVVGQPGTVMLKRDPSFIAGYYILLSDEQRASAGPIVVCGTGTTIEEAFKDAVQRITATV